jgi:hypothetical protein
MQNKLTRDDAPRRHPAGRTASTTLDAVRQ